MFLITHYRMLRYICFAIFILNVLFASATQLSAVEKLMQEADTSFNEGDYAKALQLYRDIYVINDSIFDDINTTQIEDLRRTYFIDDLSIEREKENLKFLQLWKWAISTLILLLLVGVFYLKWRKKKLLIAQSVMQDAQLKAEQSIKNKSLFLSNMSHEIRTPLNALIGFSSILTDENIDEGLRNQCNTIIKYNAHLLLNLINDVVDVACLDVEKMSFNIARHDVVELSRRIVETLEGIKQTAAEIRFVSSMSELYLMTDDVRLQQLLINIIINATKYTKQGFIELKLETDDQNQAIFTVTDTGTGISKDK